MKKILIAALSTLMISQSAMATNQLRVDITCPTSTAMAEYDNTILADGLETIYTMPQQMSNPTFYYSVRGQDVLPQTLSVYQFHEITYDSNLGIVTCQYVGGGPYSPLALNYTLLNGKGGLVIVTHGSTMTLALPVGL